MRRCYIPWMGCILLLAMVAPCGAGDAEIAKELSQRLRAAKQDGTLQDFRIGVNVENGVVWLTGRVNNDDQQTRALDIARRVPGVRVVVNDLEIGNATAAPPSDSAAGPVGKAAVPTGPVRSSQISPARKAAIRRPQASTRVTTDENAVEFADENSVALDEQSTGPVAVQFDQSQAVPTRSAVMASATPNLAASPSYVMVPSSGVMPQTAQVPSMIAVQSMPTFVQVVPAMVAPATSPTDAAPQPSRKPMPVARTRGVRQVSHHCNSEVAGPGGCYHGDGVIYDGMSYGGTGSYGGGMGAPVAEMGMADMGGAMYDNPQMPAYAWPSYASHPNYAAVSYPRQYSPQAWPYIGPFYPYPQVPLGWRKVSLEWDDGWWMLDFKSK